MSGIGAVLTLDGRPVTNELMDAALVPLRGRGPHGRGCWTTGDLGLGSTLLATSPEATGEPPVVHRGPLAIVADARIDNRSEILAQLPARQPQRGIGDAELILRAYEHWGTEVVHHLLGDFAFVIWDGPQHRLFCARDHFGVRPLYLHHQPGRLVAIASSPEAILRVPTVRRRLNEGRVADFIVNQLEGIDQVSTFFAGIERLPPAHTLTVEGSKVRTARYWTLEPQAELRLESDEAYVEAFLDVFTRAVDCRLRGGSTGSMLSGGMDSGSIVAVARQLQADRGQGPLPTFSAVSATPEGCVETDAVHAAVTMSDIEPHLIGPASWAPLIPDLREAWQSLDEPFDYAMTLPRAMYLAARARGITVMLDGIDGDTPFGPGHHMARLLRQGRIGQARALARAMTAFWGPEYSPSLQYRHAARWAFVPPRLRATVRRLRHPQRAPEETPIAPSFAARVDLAGRLDLLRGQGRTSRRLTAPEECARALNHPYLTVGIERYGRVAAAAGIEPGHPFLDRRLMEWLVALPPAQKVAGGWPKGLLRRAMAGKLPEEVRWRRGKEHSGISSPGRWPPPCPCPLRPFPPPTVNWSPPTST